MAADHAAAAGDVRVPAPVQLALRRGAPVVALESALITHGLPSPENLLAGRKMEAAVAAQGSTPATVAVLLGERTIGLTDARLVTLAGSP